MKKYDYASDELLQEREDLYDILDENIYPIIVERNKEETSESVEEDVSNLEIIIKSMCSKKEK